MATNPTLIPRDFYPRESNFQSEFLQNPGFIGKNIPGTAPGPDPVVNEAWRVLGINWAAIVQMRPELGQAERLRFPWIPWSRIPAWGTSQGWRREGSEPSKVGEVFFGVVFPFFGQIRVSCWWVPSQNSPKKLGIVPGLIHDSQSGDELGGKQENPVGPSAPQKPLENLKPSGIGSSETPNPRDFPGIHLERGNVAQLPPQTSNLSQKCGRNPDFFGNCGNLTEVWPLRASPPNRAPGNPGDIPKKTPFLGDFWGPRHEGRACPAVSSSMDGKETKPGIQIISEHLHRNFCAHTWALRPSPRLSNPGRKYL